MTRTRTPSQASVTVHYDGELSRPSGLGPTFYKKVREMRRDPTIAMARWFATAPIVAGSWSVECDEGVPPGAKELVEGQMSYLRQDLLTTALFGCYDYGWATFEKCFTQRDDGLYWCRYLKPLWPDWTSILVLEGTGEYAGVVQRPSQPVFSRTDRSNPTEIYLSTEEVMLLHIDAEGTCWYGEPYSKAAEGPYDASVVSDGVAARYDLKVAGAYVVIKYPRGTSPFNGVDTDNAVIAANLARNLHAMGSVAIPQTVLEIADTATASALAAAGELAQWKIELLSAPTTASTAIIDRQKYLDALKVRAYRYPERAILEGTFGTKAEAEAHADLAITGLDMRHAGLTSQVNRDLVNQTVRLNFGHGLDDKVQLRAAPLTDEAKAFLRELYKGLLANPDEMMRLDVDALRERLKVPTLKVVDAWGQWEQQQTMVEADPGLVEPPPDAYEMALAYNPDQPRDAETGRWDSGGATVAKAKALGFRPTSRDPWINKQQAKEHIAKHRAEKAAAKKDEAILRRAESRGFTPTSPDPFINARQAEEFLENQARSRGNGERKRPKSSGGGGGKRRGPGLVDELVDAAGDAAATAVAAPGQLPEELRKTLRFSFDPNQPRDPDGKFASGGGGGSSAIKSEDTTPPPPGKHYSPTPAQLRSGSHARVGVPAKEVPPPPPIPRLPNLTPDERAAEESFASAYEKDPDGMAQKFREVMRAAAEARGRPEDAKVFETDAAKVLSGDWNSQDAEEQAELRARYNTPLHQTANALTKRAFLQHLDGLEAGDEVLVTCGGCGAGKGYALGNIPEAAALKDSSAAVWDSAGDQNATENEWVLEAAKERGLKVTYAFVHADPESSWADPKRGVVQRANDPKNGRMVDAAVFADSYALGAKNHSEFHAKYAQDPDARFVFIDNSKGSPQLTSSVPKAALDLDRDKLYEFATKTIRERDVRSAVRRGALVGQRVWQSNA